MALSMLSGRACHAEGTRWLALRLWAGMPTLFSKIRFFTRVRNPTPASPHRHLPWGTNAGANGLRNVKQAFSGIGTVGHYRTTQKLPDCDGGYRSLSSAEPGLVSGPRAVLADIGLGIELPRDGVTGHGS